MSAYYNEIDEYAAQWLRNLIAAGHIAPGDVDTRSITEVHPDDIKNYTQCHFFAGIGVWSHALRRAGWADSRPVWTGSCPCQPFSTAGKGAGFDDDRHLWPVFGNLIRECRPATVFGEQVASKDADAWIDLVQADLESMGYAVGAVPFPAAGVGAPHIRDRLYWMARDLRVGDSGGAGLEGHHRHGGDGNQSGRDNAQSTGPVGATGGFSRVVFAAECDDEGNCPQCGDDFGDCECIGPTEDDVEYIWIDGELYGKRLADSKYDGCDRQGGTSPIANRNQSQQRISDGDCSFGGLADTVCSGLFPGPYARIHSREEVSGSRDGKSERFGTDGRLADTESTGFAHGRTGTILAKPSATGGKASAATASPLNGFWRDADWLLCRDGKWRPVSPKPQPMVDGSAESLGRVCARIIEEIEEEINAWAVESKIDGNQALRDLLCALGAQAKRCWKAGRIPGLHEAPFLLAFMRQLTEQGWRISERLPVSCEEIAWTHVRGVWGDRKPTGTSRQRGLEGQQSRERTDPMSFLSSLLARHARAAWGNAHAAYAETAHPLAIGARNRVGRLRAYGNAICAEAAVEFIKIAMEYRP